MKIVYTCLLLLIPALSTGGANDCDFDQAERQRYNLQLQKQYPGSQFIKDKYTLTILNGKDEINLSIGGCVHYGISIELKTPRSDHYENETTLMNKVMMLIETYSQGLIDIARVKHIIEEKNWRKFTPEHNDYYLLNYEKYSAFEVYRRHEGQFTIIGLYYYQ